MTAPHALYRRLGFVLAFGGFVVIAGLLTARAIPRVHQPGVVYPETDPVNWVFRDFRDGVYYPLRAVIDGVNPYALEPYVQRYPVGQDFPPYSPITFLIHWPLAWLSLPVAQWVYFAITVALTLVLARIALTYCNLPRGATATLAVAACILASRPGHMNLLLGQSTVPVVIFSLLGLRFAGTRPWIAGLCLALATLKPTYGLPLIVLVSAMGYFRAAVAGLAVTVLLTLPLIIWIGTFDGGWSGMREQIVQREQILFEHPGRDPARSFSRIDAVSVAARALSASPSTSLELGTGVVVVGLGCLILIATRRWRSGMPILDPPSALALIVMLVALYHHAYDALVLVPVWLYGWKAGDEFWRAWKPAWRWLWCGLIAIPLINYASTNTVIERWDISGVPWVILTSMNGVAVLMAGAILATKMLRTAHPIDRP